VWVAIDVAKAQHEVLIERRDGRRIRMTVANALSAFEKLATFLATLSKSCEVALEPTGDYHRPLANFLLRQGHHVHFVSSIACHRTREALFNSWDKNDPKDAQVILHLLKGGVTQRFSDPLEEGNHDFQELLGTYRRIVDRKVRVYHTLMTHYLPLYFPEAEPFIASSRSERFLNVFSSLRYRRTFWH
jgi:transposase